MIPCSRCGSYENRDCYVCSPDQEQTTHNPSYENEEEDPDPIVDHPPQTRKGAEVDRLLSILDNL